MANLEMFVRRTKPKTLKTYNDNIKNRLFGNVSEGCQLLACEAVFLAGNCRYAYRAARISLQESADHEIVFVAGAHVERLASVLISSGSDLPARVHIYR